jgi:uncharacterized membrane protein YedE/YeeE/rhodanese-related sulfurtransferase
MDMKAPFYEFGLFGIEISLLFAFVIGISFGFFLEKGGLGNSRKLAGQFYLTDFTVFKVMFSAIVTAMLGLFMFAWIGILDLSLISLSSTYVVPYLVAGLLFGMGFVIGGLCPGTSCVSAATGKIDGMILLLGIFFGIFIFGETFEYFNEFLFSYPLYHISIPAYFGTSFGLIVFIVVVVALIGFIGAEKVEKKFSENTEDIKVNQTLTKSKINLWLGLSAFIIALIILAAGNPYKTSYIIDEGAGIPIYQTTAKLIRVEDVAQMIQSRKNDFTIIDLRSPEKYDEYHVPSALNYYDNLSLADIGASDKKVILYSQGRLVEEKVWNKLKEEFIKPIFFLDGGMKNWMNEILFPDLNIPKGLSPEEIEKVIRRSHFFGGAPKIKKTGISKGGKYMREGC